MALHPMFVRKLIIRALINDNSIIAENACTDQENPSKNISAPNIRLRTPALE
jgi:hypothetical protein